MQDHGFFRFDLNLGSGFGALDSGLTILKFTVCDVPVSLLGSGNGVTVEDLEEVLAFVGV